MSAAGPVAGAMQVVDEKNENGGASGDDPLGERTTYRSHRPIPGRHAK